MNKGLLLVIVALLSCASCDYKTTRGKKTTPIALTIENDNTKSFQYGRFTISDVSDLVESIAKKTGGTIEVIQVTNISKSQNIMSVSIPYISDTIDLNGNILEQEKAKKKNREARERNNQILNEIITLLTPALIQNNQYDRSDYNGANLLTSQVLSQAIYSSGRYKRVLLICGDLLQDAIPNKKESITPIQFDKDIRVCLVRPAISQSEITNVFPNNKPETYTSVHNFILSL